MQAPYTDTFIRSVTAPHVTLFGDHRTLSVTRTDGLELTYTDCEVLFKHSPQMRENMKLLRVLLG